MLISPRASARVSCALVLAVAHGLALPFVTANDSLLTPPSLRLPGESGASGVAIDVPPFLQPLATDAPAYGTVPQSPVPSPQHGWTGDAGTPSAGSSERSQKSPLPTDAERDFAAAERWRRRFVPLMVVLLVCVTIASFAVLITVAHQR